MDVKTAYGTVATPTFTLNGLAAGGKRQSAAVDNSSDKYLDFLWFISLKHGTAPTTGDYSMSIVLSLDGTTWNGGASGSDSAYTPSTDYSMSNLMSFLSDTAQHIIHPTPIGTSVAQFCGGWLPKKFAFVFENGTDQALAGSDNYVQVLPVYATVT